MTLSAKSKDADLIIDSNSEVIKTATPERDKERVYVVKRSLLIRIYISIIEFL